MRSPVIAAGLFAAATWCKTMMRTRIFLRLSRLAPLYAFAGELVQHAVEWQLGMFMIGHDIGSGREKTIWLLFGGLKAIGFLLTALVARRFLADLQPRVLRDANSLSALLLMAGAMVALYWCHYHLIASAVGARPIVAAALLFADGAIVSVMALCGGLLWHLRDSRRTPTAR